jgi:prepilin-type N-terminal cleavage/methylation domain-containing protein
MSFYPKLRRSQQGFTIVELMIATAVLSTMLVAVSVIMINIGNLYYKGVNQAKVQQASRDITAEIADSLQLSVQTPRAAADPTTGAQAICIGTTRYTYIVGAQIGKPLHGGSTAFKHVLWRDTIRSADTCLTANLTSDDPSIHSDGVSGTDDASDGTELMIPHSRLINFSVSPLVSPYSIKVGVAYGDDELLCSPTKAGTCNRATAMGDASDYQRGDLICKGAITHGDQFCSTSSVSTTAVQRLTAD